MSAGATRNLRACLLSGGESRRMGRDKALLPHPNGGTWLERTLQLLLALEVPVTVLSRHSRHRQLAEALHDRRQRPCRQLSSSGLGLEHPLTDSPWLSEAPLGSAPSAPRLRDWGATGQAAAITALDEPPPWEGPLLALHRLMQLYPDERLLLCPVDMPDLSLAALEALLAAAAAQPERLHSAHDGERLQPLLGVYPSSAPLRNDLAEAVERGERRLQRWLASQAIAPVRLDPQAIRNLNHPPDAGAAR